MLARHAESLFWAGRYLERAEDTARMLDVTYHGLLESAPADEEAEAWRDLLDVLNLATEFDHLHAPGEIGAHPGGVPPLTAATVSEFLVLDGRNPGSIVSSVVNARENMRSVRELISTELWEAVNTFHLELNSRDLRNDVFTQPYELYGLVKRRCQTASGVANETMPRDDGWRFLRIGWLLERAEMTCRLINVRYEEAAGANELEAFHVLGSILKSASASEAYRKTYGAVMDPLPVVDYLLLARQFPRSVLSCLARAEEELLRLGDDPGSLPRRVLGRIRSQLEFADVTALCSSPTHLTEELDSVQAGVREVCDAIALQYFRNIEVDIRPIEFHPVALGFE
jgi:uncharacterized alpha-E superfamily protein